MPKHAIRNSFNIKVKELVDSGNLHIDKLFGMSNPKIFGYEKSFDIIRKKALTQKMDLGLIRNVNEECEQYWKIWADSSTVANTVRLLVCITNTYNSKYYIKPQEVLSIT